MDEIDVIKRKYHRHLLNFILRLIEDEGLVEDIGQEVFLNVYKSLKDFDEKRGTPFSAWLFITARNHCISELRKRRGKIIVPIETTSDIRAKDKTAEETLIENEKWQAVKTSVEQLPEPYRSTILQSLHGDSLNEIAVRDSVSPGTVKSRLFRAREKMKLLVKEYFGGKGYERV
ncbi:MAG: sigma-70 family RNA polymerase sigma factor [Nitrospirae bacterium]|nr:sigma-70 family RNA polymerase sigma factor [Nitrospirota bacterium]